MIRQRKSNEEPEQKLNNNRIVGSNNGSGGSVGVNVLNAQGNIELTKKNNLSKKERAERRKTVMIRFGSNENKENQQQVVRFADGGMTMESTPPPKDFKRTTDRDL